MADILIRGLSSEAIARIDDEAAAQGISRNEYLRRGLEQAAPATGDEVATMDDLARAAEAARDLLDDDVMREAWS